MVGKDVGGIFRVQKLWSADYEALLLIQLLFWEQGTSVCNAVIRGWHKFPSFKGCCPENAHTEEYVNTHMFGPSEAGRGQQAALMSAKI